MLLQSGTELTLCLFLMVRRDRVELLQDQGWCSGNPGLQEVSNPFLHLRFILRALRKGNQQLMLINDAAFALSFFICRLLLGPFVVWATVASPTTPWIVKVGAIHCGCVL